ncbi:uncharacterized protein LOC143272574 [Peromyscus maniculatus bairdii]|uniref:uncharacterized protein LOC143272574 n=1 Tax=Peromyscus maniculatus bairdii TaxID=230844 RepID=UPI003FD0E99D
MWEHPRLFYRHRSLHRPTPVARLMPRPIHRGSSRYTRPCTSSEDANHQPRMPTRILTLKIPTKLRPIAQRIQTLGFTTYPGSYPSEGPWCEKHGDRVFSWRMSQWLRALALKRIWFQFPAPTWRLPTPVPRDLMPSSDLLR